VSFSISLSLLRLQNSELYYTSPPKKIKNDLSFLIRILYMKKLNSKRATFLGMITSSINKKAGSKKVFCRIIG